jgi:hypothetical protein
MNLQELLDEAQKYGNIYLHQSKEDRTFSFDIKFTTIKHVELEASSGFRHKTIESAVCAALEKAVIIVESMRASQCVDTENTQKILGIKGKVMRLIGVSK